MSARTINLGILAHVDAGKTSLTERLLHAAGVIDRLGRVDDGDTQTDSLALERQRGITIKSAVVSFALGDTTVNLIDTPGHPDFIAEVERVLCVLDGAVLVVSAVEGVQAQTRVLLRALRRLGIPTLIFVNKVDRRGASLDRVLRQITERLSPSVLAMGSAERAGGHDAGYVPWAATDPGFRTRLVDLLAGHDDTLLADYVTDPDSVSGQRLRAALVSQTRQALVHPVYAGSAVTGAGVDALIEGIRELLPADPGDPHAPTAGTVFKVDRGPAGEKLAYVRLFAGTIRVRERLDFGRDRQGKVTGISVFDQGAAVPADSVRAGRIGLLRGLDEIRIGDPVGRPHPRSASRPQFAPPTLETVVLPSDPRDRGALHQALTRLAEADPLINLRRDETRQEIAVSLYGEVQKEVIEATLAAESGLAVEFRETTTLCLEGVRGTGSALEVMGAGNPFFATVGLRVDPGPPGSGPRFGYETELGALPLAFFTAIEDTVLTTLGQGLHGWPVTDCLVTLTQSGFSSVHSTAGDFRSLTPLVLMAALRQAGTEVLEPLHRFELDLPADALTAVRPALARLDAVPGETTPHGATYRLAGELPAANVHALQRQLPGLTHGEGVLDCAFAGHRPVRGRIPERPRTDHNPLDRKEYLLHLRRRV
ncbi:elongation factor G [Crossiella cryophila]|uniref:Ribosomal protection tetracycline resistance protein n=1 Tax=Crossiella cryophila TaxID=43355 RepID=A0A7W7FU49_9PSEU|nr:TetM/TetW/TetO/TetS family tetracycline resistance ribosomal protection protein [Crossiella cryophila]MBB4677705.1 ribosomal protection tetracycline resistance protein [Crossiella cryophila]